ncbi:hypothetical protein EVG20_g6770 [Dentipellis fragilis]|uniref:Uncharacterized protein n=1 Tax=Dentipellis fragilis TaxID=205917 RepID=A0A4Y9YJC4_9AGAM|nr:hypothetical protein EVG20_g6770 [Dentipellis fragilis]
MIVSCQPAHALHEFPRHPDYPHLAPSASASSFQPDPSRGLGREACRPIFESASPAPWAGQIPQAECALPDRRERGLQIVGADAAGWASDPRRGLAMTVAHPTADVPVETAQVDTCYFTSAYSGYRDDSAGSPALAGCGLPQNLPVELRAGHGTSVSFSSNRSIQLTGISFKIKRATASLQLAESILNSHSDSDLQQRTVVSGLVSVKPSRYVYSTVGPQASGSATPASSNSHQTATRLPSESHGSTVTVCLPVWCPPSTVYTTICIGLPRAWALTRTRECHIHTYAARNWGLGVGTRARRGNLNLGRFDQPHPIQLEYLCMSIDIRVHVTIHGIWSFILLGSTRAGPRLEPHAAAHPRLPSNSRTGSSSTPAISTRARTSPPLPLHRSKPWYRFWFVTQSPTPNCNAHHHADHDHDDLPESNINVNTESGAHPTTNNEQRNTKHEQRNTNHETRNTRPNIEARDFKLANHTRYTNNEQRTTNNRRTTNERSNEEHHAYPTPTPTPTPTPYSYVKRSLPMVLQTEIRYDTEHVTFYNRVERKASSIKRREGVFGDWSSVFRRKEYENEWFGLIGGNANVAEPGYNEAGQAK